MIPSAEEWDVLPFDLNSESRRRKVIDEPYLHRLQRRHFILFDVLPFFGTVAAIALLWYQPPALVDLAMLVALWLITGLGITVGYHRLFTHRSFKANTGVRVGLAIAASMAAQGSAISWSAMHRRHHSIADQPGDMHSPNLHGAGFWNRLRGLVHAHYTWMIKHEYPNVAFYTPDLLRDTALVKTARLYHVWIVLGLALPTAIGGLVSGSWMGALSGFLWGGMVRMFLVGNLMWTLNSILHSVGTKAYRIPGNQQDESRNSFLLGIFAWGEGWHNNHHAFPQSASFGLDWYRIDFGFWLIRSFEKLGWVTEVRVPTRESIREHRAVRA
jgi:stearoyl-CoA desaturase (Delta-9 desaturase)